jgi:hypothetical protein
MGGIDPPAPVRSQEEIIAAVIEAGRNASVPNPHTVWVVENVPFGPYPYPDRSDLDNICYALPVGHLERFPFPAARLVRCNIAFYPYKERAAAEADALHRLARAGRRCFFCWGVAHSATGCHYSPTCLVCGPCARAFAQWVVVFTNGKGIRRVKARHPDAGTFYEAVGRFVGQDHRRFPGLQPPAEPYVSRKVFYESVGSKA